MFLNFWLTTRERHCHLLGKSSQFRKRRFASARTKAPLNALRGQAGWVQQKLLLVERKERPKQPRSPGPEQHCLGTSSPQQPRRGGGTGLAGLSPRSKRQILPQIPPVSQHFPWQGFTLESRVGGREI